MIMICRLMCYNRIVMEKLLSFIIPAYNCEAFIEEGLGSVLNQLPACCELIVVDDGSQDGTVRVLKKWEAEWELLKVECCEHRGASGARNRGLELAAGEYVSFIDCDDCLKAGFVSKSLKLLDNRADLYIFGIERLFMDGGREESSVPDGFYPDISLFADEYIRKRRMLIYSNCNKYYRRDLVRSHGIRFKEGMGFGEDRLFNYDYLKTAGNVVTSSLIMLEYIQRSALSMSTAHIPGFYRLISRLHEEKMGCFLALSGGTGRQERESFVDCDMYRETVKALERYKDDPAGWREDMPGILDMIYGEERADRSLDLDLDEVPDPAVWKHRPCDNDAIKDMI